MALCARLPQKITFAPRSLSLSYFPIKRFVQICLLFGVPSSQIAFGAPIKTWYIFSSLLQIASAKSRRCRRPHQRKINKNQRRRLNLIRTIFHQRNRWVAFYELRVRTPFLFISSNANGGKKKTFVDIKKIYLLILNNKRAPFYIHTKGFYNVAEHLIYLVILETTVFF